MPALFPFAPNWRSPYNVSYEFRTDVFTSRSGKEQRRALRSTPRKAFSYTVTRDRADVRRLNRFMVKNQNQENLFPDLTRHVTLLNSTTLFSTSFEIDGAAPTWMQPGAYVVRDDDEYTMRQIVAVTGSTVTLLPIEEPLGALRDGAVEIDVVYGTTDLSDVVIDSQLVASTGHRVALTPVLGDQSLQPGHFTLTGDIGAWPTATALWDIQYRRDGMTVSTETVELPVFRSLSRPAGLSVFPAVVGRLNDEISVRNITDDVVEAGIAFEATPGLSVADDSGSPEEVFNGREVFLFEPNWASGIDGNYVHVTDPVDFGRGRIQTYTPISFGTRIRQFQVQFPTRQDRSSAVALFQRMKGQRGEFYLPTWEDDLTISRLAEADTFTVWVRGIEPFDAYHDDTVHRAVLLQSAGGLKFYRRITAIYTDGINTRLTTDIPWPIDMTPDVRLSWLVATRFATDRLEMECLTDEIGRVQFSTRSLEDRDVAANEDPWASLGEAARYLIDRFGWLFTEKVIAQPVRNWVNVAYPKTASETVLNDGVYWLNRHYGQPYATSEISDPLHVFVNVNWPGYFPEN